MSIKIAVVGATGYAGAELIRLLLTHPKAELTALCSVSYQNKTLSEVYPTFYTFCDKVCEDQSEAVDKSDLVFACLPHGLSEPIAKECIEKGKKFIDLGADFRLEKQEDYAFWYQKEFLYPDLHKSAVYCIPELQRENAKAAQIIANPGCYPTSVALGLYPALENGFVKTDSIIIDSKSGVTGAGRALTQTTHYPDCNEAFSPYKVAIHRHTPEIEQVLSKAAKADIKVTFVPHLLPINRGIVSTMYLKVHEGVSFDDIYNAYYQKYKNETFVRLLKKGDTANLKNVKYTNLCDISLHYDSRTDTLVVVSTIDNMVKGAAGQAIQNMNIIMGLPEDTGLKIIPPAF